jgi:hypothetical protein
MGRAKEGDVPDHPPDHSRDDVANLDRKFVAVLVTLTIVWFVGAYWLLDWLVRSIR